MKVIASTLVLLILAGCSPEDTSLEVPDRNSLFNKKSGTSVPDNPANPNDHTGIIYQQILDAYYPLSDIPAPGLEQVISQGNTLAFQNPGFLAQEETEACEPVTAAEIEPYLQIEGQAITGYLSDQFSTAAKQLFLEIQQSLRQMKQSDAAYNEVYDYLLLLEARIVSENTLTEAERSAILTTTSILRNAMYHDKKRRRRDRDWEWMTGHIAATANGALESKPRAILMSFATDVYAY